MSSFRVRRVVTGVDGEGHAALTDDGIAPITVQAGPVGVSEVLWCERAERRIGDAPDRGGDGFPLEPPPGGASARVIRMPGAEPGSRPDSTWLRVDGDDPDVPGRHATDTLDLMVVLEGSVVLGLDDGQRTISAGEFVVQRGTRHRWRPADEEGWTYLVVMLRPDRTLRPGPDDGAVVHPPRRGDRPVRRVVTGTPTLDGGASVAVAGAHTTLTDLWQTGGPLRRPDQGGDPDAWTLEPVGGGVAFRLVEISPDLPVVEELWHRTATIDVDVVLSGHVRLDLPGGASTVVGPGEVVVQRGTEHRWTVVGDEPLRMAAVMLAATP